MINKIFLLLFISIFSLSALEINPKTTAQLADDSYSEVERFIREYKGIYVLPKIILSSALQELANEYKDSMKKIGYGEEVDNLKHF